MPKVSREYLEERRAEILAAASRCFAREGFHRATMHDIVTESGLSPGAIYRYFASKEAIIAALADERHARETELVADACAKGDLASALRSLLASFVEPLAKRRERAERRLNIQLWAEALRDDAIRKIVRRGVDEPREHLVALATAAAARGDLPAGIDPDSLARAFIALFHGFILQQAWDEDADVVSYVATLEMIIASLTTARARVTVRR